MYSVKASFSSTGDLTATPPSSYCSSSLSPTKSLFFNDDTVDDYDDGQLDSSPQLCIYLSTEDPTETVFFTSSGQKLYKTKCFIKTYDARPTTASSTKTSYCTRVVRLYGKTARAVKEAKERRGLKNVEGLTVAEMEWLERTRSSRIRFGRAAGSSKHDVVDVRVDEFLKNTKGRGQSAMFASSEGKIYKWKAYKDYPVELVECEDGRRISHPLVTYHEAAEGDGGFAHLRVSTSVLPIIDQVIVSWVIMERERRVRLAALPRP
ncbi:hypothetical protein FRC18_006265 [Serendipita sp. 400]|nr:hypothetical protein FRC18_006265 [Serendipita sp. 400]